jgi:hypothetical protein
MNNFKHLLFTLLLFFSIGMFASAGYAQDDPPPDPPPDGGDPPPDPEPDPGDPPHE